MTDQVLVYVQSKELMHSVNFTLETKHGLKGVPQNNIDEIIRSLKTEDHHYSGIIAELGTDYLKLQTFLQGAYPNLPVIIWYKPGDPKPNADGTNTQFIESATLLKELGNIIEQHLNKNSPSNTKAYCRIKTELLPIVSPLESDIYIYFQSQEKFLRIFQNGDVFDLNDLQRYLNTKKLDYFYIKSEAVDEFIKKLKNYLDQALKPGSTIDPKAFASTSGAVHEALGELLTHVGATTEVQSMVKSSASLAMKSLKKTSKLSSFLKDFEDNPEKYIYNHSQILAQAACVIATALEWKSEATFYKIHLAATLHDIVLKNQELAKVDSIKELEKSGNKFTPDEKKIYLKHPILGAELAREFEDIPQDVDSMILQHHERPDGTGFPRKLGHRAITPLAVMFIIAHDFSHYVLENGKNSTVEDFAHSVQDKYNMGEFKRIIRMIMKAEKDPDAK